MRKLKQPIIIESSVPWGAGVYTFTHFDGVTQCYRDPGSGAVISKDTLARIKKGKVKWHKLAEEHHADRG